LAHIVEQVKALERAVAENPGLAFDLARTLVESACRTILAERKQAFSEDDDLQTLFKAVTKVLPFLPSGATTDGSGRKSLLQTVNGLHTALQGVCELRNAFGFASHGSSGPRPVLEVVQATLAAQAADAIVGFLYSTHRQDQRRPVVLPLRYEDTDDFNTSIDEDHGEVRILDLTYRPSEVLFRVDIEAYRDALAQYRSGDSAKGGET